MSLVGAQKTRADSVSAAGVAALPRRSNEEVRRFGGCTALLCDLWLLVDAAIVMMMAPVAMMLLHAAIPGLILQPGPVKLTAVLGAVAVAGALKWTNCNTVLAVLQGPAHRHLVLSAIVFAFSAMVLLSGIDEVFLGHSGLWFAEWFVLSAAGVLAGRVLAARVLAAVLDRGWTARNIAMISAPGRNVSLPAILAREPDVRLWGVLRMTEGGIDAQARDYSGAPFCLAGLFAACRSGAVDEIVVKPDGFSPVALGQLLDCLKSLPNATWLDRTTSHAATSVACAGGEAVIQVSARPIGGWRAVAKEVFDRLVAAAGLLVLAPLFAAIALAIKLGSPGPVFFRQRRIGYLNEEFRVWKFRTMTVTEDGPEIRQAERNDPRVTAVGRLLRVTSLDEIPQLINVLKGDMSLVGPRPHAVAHHEAYRKVLPGYASRHRVKPGITGLAQIHGLRGPTETPEKMQRRLERDLEYVQGWSLWSDVKILLLTPMYGFVNQNAH